MEGMIRLVRQGDGDASLRVIYLHPGLVESIQPNPEGGSVVTMTSGQKWLVTEENSEILEGTTHPI